MEYRTFSDQTPFLKITFKVQLIGRLIALAFQAALNFVVFYELRWLPAVASSLHKHLQNFSPGFSFDRWRVCASNIFLLLLKYVHVNSTKWNKQKTFMPQNKLVQIKNPPLTPR